MNPQEWSEKISEMELSRQTRWRNYELENARDLGGWANLLGCKEVSSVMAYISSILVSPILLTGRRCGVNKGTKAVICVMKAESLRLKLPKNISSK